MKKKTNIPKAFIFFLIASLLMWFLINLSKEYKTIVSYPVNYQALPQNKLLQKKPLEQIDLLLKGTGFKLLAAKFSRKKILLATHTLLKKNKTHFYLLPNNNLLEIQQQLGNAIQVERILQDSIFFKIGNLTTKTIPVIANTNLQFEVGYNLASELEIKPDTIKIFGSNLLLDTIKNIKTATLFLENIHQDFNKEVNLQLPKNTENLRFNTKKVTLIGKVDKFTEGSFEVPFLVENLPFGTTLNTFPKTVKVTYKVGLKNFNKITPDAFTVTCNYQLAKENNVSYLVPKIKNQPVLVSSVKIEPNKIDFLIHK